jgi:Ceramidase
MSMVDLYCERIGAGILAEPVNVVTNAAFFIAAWAAWSLARRSNALSTDIRVLTALSIMIGVGSGLFHAFATGWARFLDEVPILLFQLWYLWLYTRRIMTLRVRFAATSIAGYMAAAIFCRRFPHLLNGSLIYAPALILMLCLGLYHLLQNKRERFLLLATMGIFLASLTFRSIDNGVCSHVPIGAHFLWHILNGVVLYLSMRALILNQSNRPA